MQKQVLAQVGGRSSNERAIMRVELVLAKNVWEYQPGPKETFYKITCSMPNLVTATRSAPLYLLPRIWQHISQLGFLTDNTCWSHCDVCDGKLHLCGKLERHAAVLDSGV
jgi:hypothetical protein